MEERVTIKMDKARPEAGKDSVVLKDREVKDREELYLFYKTTITHTFRNNGIEDPSGINNEVNQQMDTFDRGEDILTARLNGRIVGTIAFGRQNKSVSGNLPPEMENLPEIKGVYVHPDYQSRGIGSLLWKSIITRLHYRNVSRACLDSGYRQAQRYWKEKIGKPDIVMKDYWGPGEDQMIWFLQIENLYKGLL